MRIVLVARNFTQFNGVFIAVVGDDVEVVVRSATLGLMEMYRLATCPASNTQLTVSPPNKVATFSLPAVRSGWIEAGRPAPQAERMHRQ